MNQVKVKYPTTINNTINQTATGTTAKYIYSIVLLTLLLTAFAQTANAQSKTIPSLTPKTNNIIEYGLIPLNRACEVYKIYNEQVDSNEKAKKFGESIASLPAEIAGYYYGSQIGTVLGGVIGSAIPVIGTGIGATAGGFIGGIVGSIVGDKGTRYIYNTITGP